MKEIVTEEQRLMWLQQQKTPVLQAQPFGSETYCGNIMQCGLHSAVLTFLF